jgi:nicotinamidase/pyrazinamidase
VTDDPHTSDLLELLLAGRPDRVTRMLLASEADGTKNEAAALANALGALGLSADPVPPSAALRARVLSSVEARAKQARRPNAAVLVIDMLNDHLSPGRPLEVPRARDIVPALNARLDAARKQGIPVVYVVDRHEPDDPDLDEWTTHNVKGTQGDEVWPDVAPKPSDRVVHKPTYSAFTQSTLEKVLDELQVDTLVLTGCLTEIGLLATATDALQRGYAVEIPRDSQAGSSEQAEEVAMSMLGMMPPYGAARKARLDRLEARA